MHFPIDHDCSTCNVNEERRRFVGVALGFAFAAALPVRLLHATERRAADFRYPIPPSDSVSIDSANEVIVVRWGAKVYAFSVHCPHQNTPLHWLDGDKNFQCPKHKSRFTPDGGFISGRATRAMDRFAVRKEGDQLVVDTATKFKQDEDAAGWSGAEVTL